MVDGHFLIGFLTKCCENRWCNSRKKKRAPLRDGPGTASLNVSVAASIVMHHFGLWAQYTERGREGEKYVVAERRERTQSRGVLGGETPEEVHER